MPSAFTTEEIIKEELLWARIEADSVLAWGSQGARGGTRHLQESDTLNQFFSCQI